MEIYRAVDILKGRILNIKRRKTVMKITSSGLSGSKTIWRDPGEALCLENTYSSVRLPNVSSSMG